jgi:acyl-CoA synthetase (NDP forming)
MDLTRLFYPRSIAVVGASPNMGDGKIPWYQILRGVGYQGELYPVNPAHKEIHGVPVLPALSAVPDGVDLAIVSVPARHALSTLQAAVDKRIKFVHFFTSGFSEAGNRQAEEELIRAARAGGTRILGPNCIGAHCTGSRLTFDPSVRPEPPGAVGFLGQSGGVTNNFARAAQARKVDLNKAVSYGNQIDLRVDDFLDYFADDAEIKVIAAYIEDVKDGRAFITALNKATARKPVVVLKGGATEAGALAAMSHTGAMSGRREVFSAVMRQTGCIEVTTPEEMLDVVMLATAPRPARGPRVAFLGAGGGTSVLFTDLAVAAGLTLPPLAEKSQALIAAKIPNVNTSTTNPVDLGAFGVDFGIMELAIRAIAHDQNIDVIVPYFSLDFASMFKDGTIEQGLAGIIAAARETDKLVAPVISRSADDLPRLEHLRLMALSAFRAAGLPVFNTTQDAVRAVAAAVGASRKR